MKRFIVFLLASFMFFSCQKDKLYLSTPFLLAFPNGKPWVIKELTVRESTEFTNRLGVTTISDSVVNVTSQFDYDIMTFYTNMYEPNSGSININSISTCTWVSSVQSNNNEFLKFNYQGSESRFKYLNANWRITDKFINQIVLVNDGDEDPRTLTITVHK